MQSNRRWQCVGAGETKRSYGGVANGNDDKIEVTCANKLSTLNCQNVTIQQNNRHSLGANSSTSWTTLVSFVWVCALLPLSPLCRPYLQSTFSQHPLSFSLFISLFAICKREALRKSMLQFDLIEFICEQTSARLRVWVIEVRPRVDISTKWNK